MYDDAGFDQSCARSFVQFFPTNKMKKKTKITFFLHKQTNNKVNIFVFLFIKIVIFIY